MTSLREIFGTNLRALRKLRGLSQASLAEKAEISTDMLGRLERGTASPSFESIETLATVLEVPAGALFGANTVSDQSTPRGRSLQQISADLARANDEQIFLIRRLIRAVFDQER